MEAPGGYEGYNGGAFNRDTWTGLHPATMEAVEAESSTTWIYLVVAAAVVAAVVVIVALRRRRPEIESGD